MDFDFLTTLRREHPGWRLLAATNAPFVAAFLYRYFIEPNQRSISEAELESYLTDFLFYLRQQLDEDAFPKSARDYLNDWTDDEHAWLSKRYPKDSDEPVYDLTPATEKALQ